MKEWGRSALHNLLDRLWARNDLTEQQAMDLAVDAQHAVRRHRR